MDIDRYLNLIKTEESESYRNKLAESVGLYLLFLERELGDVKIQAAEVIAKRRKNESGEEFHFEVFVHWPKETP